jgi:hypothetical protein
MLLYGLREALNIFAMVVDRVTPPLIYKLINERASSIAEVCCNVLCDDVVAGVGVLTHA